MQTAATETRKLTYDDFLLFPDDGRRHELIDGVHYVTPSPVLRHQVAIHRRAADGSFPLVETLERAPDSILTSPLLPGIALSVQELLK